MEVGGARVGAAHLPDVLYINRPGDDNEELRYSLRSVAANVPHRKVWVAGHCPWWVKNVEVIELPPCEDKFDNQTQSLQAALDHPGLAEEFYYFNDDMFVVERFEGLLPPHHLGPLDEYVDWLRRIGKRETSEWFQGLLEAQALLESWGVEDPICYEGHSPLRFRKTDMRRFVAARTPHFLPVQCYAASDLPAGVRQVDAKSGKLGCPIEAGMPYLSSDDDTFESSKIGHLVRDMFPSPCYYEGAPVWTLPDHEGDSPWPLSN
jgi:hypothetical protein